MATLFASALLQQHRADPALAPVRCSWGAAPRGMVTEIAGSRSSGRTAFVWNAIARATQAGEVCAVVDAASRVDPAAAERAGVDLRRLLWVRCQGSTDAAFRAADMLLHAGGFAILALDLCDAPERDLRRVPLSYWFRFRRAVEGSATALLVCASRPVVGTCASLQIETQREAATWRGTLPFPLLESVEWRATARKPIHAGSERVMAAAG
jgi:recA bacterial DNA recombination protein